jgi:hypothetical protein
MRNHYGWFLGLVALALTLAGCGGDQASSFASSSSSSSSSSGGNSSKVATLTLTTSLPQIPSDGSKPATITAVALNANNVVVPGIPVTFSSTSGALAPQVTSSTVTAGTTDANGDAAASLSTPNDPTNRSITVTAAVGAVTANVVVQVIGTTVQVSGPTSLIVGATGTFSVAVTNSSNVGIPGEAVTLASALGNGLSAPSVTTDATGHATFVLTASKAGTDSITAKTLGLTGSASLNVSSQSFAITVPAATPTLNVALNTAQTVTAVWTNSGAPVVGQTVTFSTTRGTFASGGATVTATTNASGAASASLSAASAGPAVITAAGTGVTSEVTIEFVATNPAAIDVQASPATVPTQGTSTITAIVFDAQQNLVQGQTIDFQLTDKTGGSLTVATAVTDSQGRAQTEYQATSTASAANGVQITATVAGTAIANTVVLTVGGQTVFLSLGTGNTITELPVTGPPYTQFSMPFAVQALDGAGNAVPGVTVTLTVHSFPQADVPSADLNADGSTFSSFAAYFKGFWVPFGSTTYTCNGGYVGTAYCQHITTVTGTGCYNEDVDGSGILKSPGEDINGNGRLDPGDVAVVSPGTITTDSTGSGFVTVVYPEDHAGWVHVKLIATATVTGTQSTTNAVFVLPILATYIDTATETPPGFISPYGDATSCANPN